MSPGVTYHGDRKVEYATGTSITYCTASNRSIREAYLMCPDGRVRKAAHIGPNADTAFSIPAAMRVRNQYVRGYATVLSAHSPDAVGPVIATEDDPATAIFVPHNDEAHKFNPKEVK